MCNKQKDCGCGTKGGIKPTLKYCGSELPCTGIVKGDDYSTVLQKIDAVACSGGGGDCCEGEPLRLKIFGVDVPNQSPLPYQTFNNFQVQVTGGFPPYSYEWSLQQSGGSMSTIVDKTVIYPVVAYSQSLYGTTTVGLYPDQLTNPTNNSSGSKTAFKMTTDVGSLEALHLKLIVTDSKGNEAVDYWNTYFQYYL